MSLLYDWELNLVTSSTFTLMCKADSLAVTITEAGWPPPWLNTGMAGESESGRNIAGEAALEVGQEGRAECCTV